MNTLKFFMSALLIMLWAFLPTGTSHADPLNLVIDDTGAGLSLASAGVGLENLGSGTETVEINIGGPVISAHLYWAGREDENVSVSPAPEDQELIFEGMAITGDIIGSEIVPYQSHNIGYRADVTVTEEMWRQVEAGVMQCVSGLRFRQEKGLTLLNIAGAKNILIDDKLAGLVKEKSASGEPFTLIEVGQKHRRSIGHLLKRGAIRVIEGGTEEKNSGYRPA